MKVFPHKMAPLRDFISDEMNENIKAVIGKACQELKAEIKRLEPEGDKISLLTLKLVILNSNAKLRRKGTISAYELIHQEINTRKNA